MAYDEGAEAPTWLAFLDRIMAGDRELIDFLQRAIGYSLTGDTREHCLFILYGTGRNGKSTKLETLRALLGDYAMQTPAETLLVKRENAIPNDIARLRGGRFVAASESEDGKWLAESLVKQLSGGDTLSARFMRGEWFDFLPTFKTWLATNHKPVIRGTDVAIWSRIRLVPFDVRIPDAEQDKGLGARLRAELPGILRWAVAGCLAWQRDGLGAPAGVRRATDRYREEMDVLAGFLADRCLVAPTAQASAAGLYKAYTEWCEASGEKPLSQRALGPRLLERGFAAHKGTGGQRLWRGVGVVARVADSGANSGISE